MHDFIGKYELLKELGRGATSAVYLARDPFAERLVALKLVRSDALGDAMLGRRFRKLFLAEAALAGRLRHPHIAAIHDAVSDESGSYIVMEYVDGTTLERFCQPDTLMPVAQVVELSFKCCRAMDHAHRIGVIHRDIKPANVLLTRDGDIKITDFGAALALVSETTQVAGVGSPAYMSPEQVREAPLDHRTDIFSLGVLLYQLLTGRLPFRASSQAAMTHQILTAEPPPPSRLRHGLPEALDTIVACALRKDPAERFDTWEAFADALAGVFHDYRPEPEVVPETEKFDTLRRLAFFQGFTDPEIWQVVRLSAWARLRRDTDVVREGEGGRSFFVLASGKVRVTKSGRLLTTLGAGECFGEMSYLGTRDAHRSATVTADEDVTLVEIGAEALAESTEACRDRFNAAFLALLVARLEASNIRVSQLLTERNIAVH